MNGSSVSQHGYYWGAVAAELTANAEHRSDLDTGGLIYISSVARQLRDRLLTSGDWLTHDQKPATDDVQELESKSPLFFDALFAAARSSGEVGASRRMACTQKLLDRRIPIATIEYCQGGLMHADPGFFDTLRAQDELTVRLEVFVVCYLIVPPETEHGDRFLWLVVNALSLPPVVVCTLADILGASTNVAPAPRLQTA